ncbi:MAG: FAD:protein FMN transferase [Desulfuromonas sp.]|nr:FAD:protein FMN transferase [Desulfuromonas sp.]
MKRRLAVLFVLIAVAGSIFYLNKFSTTDNHPILISGNTMGTSYHLKIVPTPDSLIDRQQLNAQITARLDDIDHKMSTYKTDSDLSRFNRQSAGNWVNISSETYFVIQAGQKISQLSDGAFDITVGKLVNLWGFGPTINATLVPDPATIQQLQSNIGYQKLELQEQPPALLKHSEQVYIDLSAIAKGYAVDAVTLVLEQNNIDNYMVEIGGEIRTHGHKNVNQPWIIGVESPVTTERAVQKVLHLGTAAMATSGDYRNYFEHEGKRFSHTIDPRNGYPIGHKLASVTVIADSCMEADALATALMVLGPERGMQFAEDNTIAAFMIIKQGNGFAERQSHAFAPFFQR